MKKYCYVGGKVTTLDKASVAVNDIGLLRGYGVFDFLRTYNGKPFHLKDHFARFKKSAQIIGLKVPVTEVQVSGIISELLKKNKCVDASIRLVLTGGITHDGMSHSQPNFYVLMEDLYLPPVDVYKKGAKLITREYQRVFPGAKNTNYLMAVRLQKEKNKQKAVEILYVSNGRVLEASTSNVFLIKGQKLVTPKEDILPGITRKLVIKFAKQLGFDVEAREVSVKELLAAPEVFITATNKKIIPIVKIDDHQIGNGQIGEQTKKLSEKLLDYYRNY